MFKGQTKAIFGILVLMLAIMAVSVSAVDIEGLSIEEVKVNGHTVVDSATSSTKNVIDRDNTLTVEIKVQADNNTYSENVEVTAFITGYEYNDDPDVRLSDTSEPFTLEQNDYKWVKLNLKLPVNVEKDEYQLRIVASTRNSQSVVKNYNLRIEPERHSVSIKDVQITPGTEIVAGRGLITQVLVKNHGEKTEEDVKVTVSIPELGLSVSDWIDEIKSDESEQTEELYLRIPGCSKGQYQMKVEIVYDSGNGKDSQAYTLNVQESEACEAITPSTSTGTTGTGNVVITVGQETQSVPRGEGGVIYPITISNNGKTSRSFTLDIQGASDWATTKVSPSNVVVVNAGQTQTAYVYVAAKENAAIGQKMFSVNVKSGSETLKQIPLTAQVVQPVGASNIKKALSVAIVVLVIILIGIGLYFGYKKIKESGEGEQTKTETPSGDDIAQTYY